MKRIVPIALLGATLVVGGYYIGLFDNAASRGPAPAAAIEATPSPSTSAALTPAVSVAAVVQGRFVDSVLVTGSLVARNEILIAPEVEGLRIVELLAEEGDVVTRGQVLARIENETLDAQLAQNEASLARSAAAIAQARSQIVQAEARLTEAKANFERAQPLKKSGALSEAIYDQREAAARTADAILVAAHDGLKLAEAERAQITAQRRELTWRRERTEIKAPVDGIVSRRNARVGAVASAAGVAEPMFRMVDKAEIELEAEVPEADIGRVKDGQSARIKLASGQEIEGRVRLVSPEVDRATRLGKVRIGMGRGPGLRVGSFARGTIEVASASGLSVPASAVVFSAEGAQLMVVFKDVVAVRRITTGLVAGDRVEIKSGLKEGELVVVKAGTFLRDGDRVRPVRVPTSARVSEVN